MTDIDWNKSSNEDNPDKEKKKWNYLFLESLKMALFLPVVILLIEIYLLDNWSEIVVNPIDFLLDYLFMFSIIFLIFVIFHLWHWKRIAENNRKT